MPCYHPVSAYRTPDGISFTEHTAHPIKIPCGQCIGCRLRRVQDWTLRCTHEASAWESNSFITLTYGRDKLPPNGSLHHPDFQNFMKRLRFHHPGRPIRYYMCGEYGPQTQRPHYHANLFNMDFPDGKPCGKSDSGNTIYKSATLEQLWGHGHCTVQPFTPQTAAYTARYIVDKLNGQLGDKLREYIDTYTGEIKHRTPEYSKQSLKPGIGANWYAKYQSDVHPNDYIIHKGRKHQVPKYYDKLLLQTPLGDKEPEIKLKRQDRANTNAKDNTQARLDTKEIVKRAQIRNQTRTEP